ncbi:MULTISPECIES: hypothetical protein [unclassified Microbacterium]|nr:MULTISPECIES: hypothetical protein [unclassified Microbacterium]
MTSIAELEHRLQLAQEARADAERSVKLHEFRERCAQEALTLERLRQGEL